MGKGLKIYLFRHGQTTFNRDGKFTGHLDAKLTSKGKLQANTIARKLKNKKFQVAIHTRLSRSKDTLKPVLKFHPECKKIIQDDRMIERSYGILEGSSHKDFVNKIGKQEYDLRISGDALENIENKRLIKKIQKFLGEKEYEAIHRGYKIKVPKGESFYDVEQRVKKFIDWLKKYMKRNKFNVVISAHGNSIRLFRKVFEKASVNEMGKWVIPYDKVFIYTI